jgi:hypothetical protein
MTDLAAAGALGLSEVLVILVVLALVVLVIGWLRRGRR